MAAPAPKTLTLDQAKAALNEVIAAFDEPANAERMDKARAEAAGDLQKMTMLVMPVAMSIQQPVINKYGFEANQQGAMQFAFAIMAHQADPEVAAKFTQLKSKYMPSKQASGMQMIRGLEGLL